MIFVTVIAVLVGMAVGSTIALALIVWLWGY
jgi:hypothetical protein